jgi:hypothetical protein
MTSGPAFLGRLRDRLLDQVLELLKADPAVEAAALHVHPAALTRWPTDGRIVFERRPIKTGTLSFDQLNASGSRQPATAKTADEIRRIHLSYPSWTWLSDAVASYLDLVEASLR